MEQKNLILGFDFGEKYSQFCCYDRGTHTAVSIPVKEGEEAVEFPTAIAKKRNEETWKTGPAAEKSAHAENGIWLDNLYEICMGSRICQIENRDYTPGEVLGTFLREALKMIGIERPDQQIQAMTSALYSSIVSKSETSLANSSFSSGSSFTLISLTVTLKVAGLPLSSSAWYSSGKVTLTSHSSPMFLPISCSSKVSMKEWDPMVSG